MLFSELLDQILNMIISSTDKDGERFGLPFISHAEASFRWSDRINVEKIRDRILTDLKDYTLYYIDTNVLIKDFEIFSEEEDEIKDSGNQKIICENRSSAQRFRRWIRGKKIPDIDSLAKLATFISFLLFYAYDENFCVVRGKEEIFTTWKTESRDIVIACLNSLGIKNKNIIDLILDDEYYQILAIYIALVDSSWQDKYTTICDAFIKFIHNEKIENQSKTKYIKYVIDTNKNINLRDIDKRECVDVSDLYVVPNFIKSKDGKLSSLFGDESQRILIQCESGSGKSTLIQVLSLCSVYLSVSPENNILKNTYNTFRDELKMGDNNLFPIIIRADSVELFKSEITDNTLIESALMPHYGENKNLITPYELQALIDMQEQKDLIFLIDAYDEICFNRRKSFCNSIAQLIAKYEKAKFIITSRDIGEDSFSHRLFDDFDRWNIDAFGEEEIKLLCRRWGDRFRLQRSDFVSRIISNDYLFRMSKNPYFLSQIIAIYTRVDYSALGETILPIIINNQIKKRWDLTLYSSPYDLDYFTEKIHKVMSYVAAYMFLNNNQNKSSSIVKLKQLGEHIEKAMKLVFNNILDEKDTHTLINDIKTKSGLLISVRQGYKFQNSIVEAFLIAEGLELIWRNNIMDRDNMDKSLIDDLKKALGMNFSFTRFTADILVMMFSNVRDPSSDIFSVSLFNFLKDELISSNNPNSNENILRVFTDLLLVKFGLNDITFNKQKEDSNYRFQMTKFISLYSFTIPKFKEELNKADWLKQTLIKVEENLRFNCLEEITHDKKH